MPIGVMRNVHFPSRTADYITLAEKKDLKKNNVVSQRDFSYGASSKTDGANITEMGQSTILQPGRGSRGKDAVRIELEQLQVRIPWFYSDARMLTSDQPGEALSFLKSAIPPNVDFYRQPNLAQESGSAEAAPAGTPIYGSVSTADVATSIKALLASTELAGRIALADDDIHFTNSEVANAGRIKQVGEYEIEIRVKGREESIKRKVRVLPVDASAAEQVEEMDQLSKELAAQNPVAGGEPDARYVNLEAKVQEMDDIIAEAQKTMKMPNIGGAMPYGKETGSESSPGARSETS